MTATFLEPGGDATFDLSLWTASSGSPAVVADYLNTGHVKSLQPVVASANSYLRRSSVLANAGSRISCYIYVAALPASTTTRIMGAQVNGDGASTLKVVLKSDGHLELFSNTDAKLGSTGTTALVAGSWYRISLSYTIVSTTVNAKLWVNGVLDITVTNGTTASTAVEELIIGKWTGDTSCDLRFSDIYADNGTGIDDPGNILVTAKRPFSNGTANEWTTQIGSGNSSYGSGHADEVNERALSETNGWALSLTDRKTEEYNVEAISVGDANLTNATIIDWMGWVRAKNDSASDSPVGRVIVGGVATAKTFDLTYTTQIQMAGSTSFPAGAGTDIGIDGQYTTTPHIWSLAECGVVIAYIASTAITPANVGTIESMPTFGTSYRKAGWMRPMRWKPPR